MSVHPSIEATARWLTQLIPTMDSPDSSLQWRAQPLAKYSIFVPRGIEMSMTILWQAFLESSRAQLSMRSELADLRSQVELWKGKQQRSEGDPNQAEASSLWQGTLDQEPNSSTGNYLLRRSSRPPRHVPLIRNPRNLSSSRANSNVSSSPYLYPKSIRPCGPIRRPRAPLFGYGTNIHTMRLRVEDQGHPLSPQRTGLLNSTQRLPECSICLDEMLADSIARIDSCGHVFCRECLRGHIIARLDERRFPILCPTCTATEGKGKGKIGGASRLQGCFRISSHDVYSPSEVSQSLALNLGLTDKQFEIWSEMEIAPFSVLLHCRKYVRHCKPRTSLHTTITGANGQCSWTERNMKRPTSLLAHFLTVTTHGANSVNSQSTLPDRSIPVMARQNWTI
jgi:hypothetical protein